MALRLLTEREAEVEAFKPDEWWSVEAVLADAQGKLFQVCAFLQPQCECHKYSFICGLHESSPGCFTACTSMIHPYTMQSSGHHVYFLPCALTLLPSLRFHSLHFEASGVSSSVAKRELSVRSMA